MDGIGMWMGMRMKGCWMIVMLGLAVVSWMDSRAFFFFVSSVFSCRSLICIAGASCMCTGWRFGESIKAVAGVGVGIGGGNSY